MRARIILSVCVVSALLLTSLPLQAEKATLYNALGKRAGIETLVTGLLERIAKDRRLAPQFRGIDVRRFHHNLTDQLCELSGGPCTYEGKTMRSAHAGMAITETEFNALAEQLILIMEKQGIPTWAQNRLLARLVPLHDHIVSVPKAPLRAPPE
ncbi:group I truncated hemoglobin [Halomonadaceae bacterium KBTZ08]